jgi:hypothetical protein
MMPMSVGEWGQRVSELSTSQLVLRVVVLLGPVVAVLCTGPAGRWPPWWVLVVVIGLAGGFAVLPESGVGVAVLLVALIWWALALDDGLHPLVLLAAAALLASHVAALLTAYGPGEMPLHRPLLRRWLVRGALVLAVAPVTWGLAVLLRDGGDGEDGVWLMGVAVALVATVAATVAWGTIGSESEEGPR